MFDPNKPFKETNKGDCVIDNLLQFDLKGHLEVLRSHGVLSAVINFGNTDEISELVKDRESACKAAALCTRYGNEETLRWLIDNFALTSNDFSEIERNILSDKRAGKNIWHYLAKSTPILKQLVDSKIINAQSISLCGENIVKSLIDSAKYHSKYSPEHSREIERVVSQLKSI
ncbi:Shigella flexneri OspC protein [compost metagenome]